MQANLPINFSIGYVYGRISTLAQGPICALLAPGSHSFKTIDAGSARGIPLMSFDDIHFSSRVVPYNLSAEQSVLGAILFNNQMFGAVSERARPDDFYAPVHRELYEGIRTLIGKGQIADAVTLREFCLTNDKLIELGGVKYLVNLLEGAARITSQALEYADLIRELGQRRALIEFGHALAQAARSPAHSENADMLISEAEQGLRVLAQDGGAPTAWITAEDAACMAIEQAISGAGIGIASGLSDYDRYTFGFDAGGYTILAGRPAMGKTSLALAMARGVAAQGHGAMIVSLEMGAAQLGLRLAFSIADSGPRYLGRPSCGTMSEARLRKLSSEQWEHVRKAARKAGEMPLVLDERGALTLSKIKAAAGRKLDEWRRRKIPAGLLVIDHLGLIRPEIDRRGNRVQEVSDISAGIKALAKELGIHVLALCQLNRAVEGREDKRPTLADLRDSGSLEQDADIVTFVYRDAYYLSRIPEERRTDEQHSALNAKRNVVELIVSKQRNGEIGTASVFFDEQTCLVKNLGRP